MLQEKLQPLKPYRLSAYDEVCHTDQGEKSLQQNP